MPRKRAVSEGAELGDLCGSWALALSAARLSPATRRAYLLSARTLRDFLASAGLPSRVGALRPEHLRAWQADQLARFKPATAALRHDALKLFLRWCVQEGELAASPLAGVRGVAIPEAPPPVLSDDQLRALVRACDGPRFEDKRDLALLRVLIDTGCRRGECAGLLVADVDLAARTALARTAKGGRPRALAFDAKCAQALDRYRRARGQHPRADSPRLWLGHAGALGVSGVYRVVRDRGRQAGLGDLHPHALRHAWAHRNQLAGLGETHLMALAGWRNRKMIARYAASTAAERAIEMAHRLALGDRI